MNENKSKLEKKMIFWGAADFGDGLATTWIATYLAIYLTDVLMIPTALTGVVLMITSIVDFIMAPFQGAIMGQIKPMKWGKLRSWMVVFPPITFLLFILTFATGWTSSAAVSAILFTVFYLLGRISYNFQWTANLSMISVIADNVSDKTKLTSQRMAVYYVGRIAAGYLAPAMLALYALNQHKGYLYLMLITGLIQVLGYVVHSSLSKGKESENSVVRQELSLKDTFKTLFTNPNLLVTVIVDLCSNMGTFLLPTLAVYYYKYVVVRPDLLAIHLVLVSFGSLIGSTFIRLVGKYIKNHRIVLQFAYSVMIVMLLSMRFVAYQPVAFMVLNIIMLLVSGVNQPLELNLYMDNVIYDEWKTGKNSASTIMGTSNMAVKLSTLLKSAILSFILITSGYVAGADPTPELKQALINAYTIIPAIIPGIGLLLITFVYKLDKNKVEKMKEEIAQRKAQ